jgi:iron complex transport system substrate-binding protein
VPRLVSLLPSITEIVCALGLRDALVGRSHECDYPEGLRTLPALTAPKLDAGRPSREIDDRVKQLVAEGLSVYRVDAETLRDLEPDVVLTQDHCEVCAASLPDVEEALARWTGRKPQVLSLDPRELEDVWGDLERVAQVCGRADRGRELADQLRAQTQALADRAATASARPSVACVEWIDPLMAAGNWVPELVELAGGENLFGSAGEHSPWLDWETLRDADPDVIIVLPCGFDIPRTRAELPPLLAQPGFAELRAAREGRIYLTDGNQYFNRPGPRLLDSLQILGEILHPDLFAPTLEGRAWVRHSLTGS